MQNIKIIKMKTLKNKLTKFIMIPIIAGGLNGCNMDYSKQEQSEILYEKGKVKTTLYSKEHTSTDVAPGITTGGDIAISVSSTTIPEMWGAVFRCEHGNKFPIMGKEEKYKKLWEKLDEGDSVRISYRENYNIEYNGKTKEVISKKLTDYDFIDAEKIWGNN